MIKLTLNGDQFLRFVRDEQEWLGLYPTMTEADIDDEIFVLEFTNEEDVIAFKLRYF